MLETDEKMLCIARSGSEIFGTFLNIRTLEFSKWTEFDYLENVIEKYPDVLNLQSDYNEYIYKYKFKNNSKA